MKIRFLIIVVIVIFATFVALIFGAVATSYLYTKIWLASGNDVPECLKFASNVIHCEQMNNEYIRGLDLWSIFISFSILITSVIVVIKLYIKKNMFVRND